MGGLNGYILALASAVTYGAADFMGGMASRRASTLAVVLWSQMAGILVVIAGLVVLPAATPGAADLAWGAAAGIAGIAGVGLLYHALSIAPMSVVAPVTGVCALSLPVLVGLIAGERPGIAALAGVPVAAVAVTLISREGSIEAAVEGRSPSTRGLMVALMSGMIIGLFLVLLAQASPRAGLWPLLAARGAAVSAGLAFAGVARRGVRLERRVIPLVLLGGITDMMANVLYLLAAQRGLLSVVATLTSLYPGATVLLAALLLRERLRPVQLAGLACAAVAIVLMTS
ncbi:MAG TPA: EamA family transporter [Longimicrobium sp.]|nr:EamA family transporter [Longimicrobium sp.]